MLDRDQITSIERRLLEERNAAISTLREAGIEIATNPQSGGDISKYPTHLADQASDTQEEELDTIIVERHSDRIQLIDDALRRLRESPDSFGASVVSGLPIPYERLRLIPWTRVLAGEAEPAQAPGGGAAAQQGGRGTPSPRGEARTDSRARGDPAR